MLRALLTETECTRESHLLYLKSFLTNFLLSYRKKHLKKRTNKLIEALRRSMGVHCVVLAGYDVPKRFRAANTDSGLRTT
jgi:hypothetical protein